MKKKTLIICVTLALLVSFVTGCGKTSSNIKEDESSTPNKQSDSIVEETKLADDEINFWWFPLWNLEGKEDGNADDWPKAMGEEFMAKNPHVKKVNVELLDWGDGMKKLDTAVAAGSPPDLCYVDMGFLPKYYKQDVIIPINEYLKDGEMEDFFASATDYCTYDGKLYAYPILIAPRVMYANKTILDEMGVGNLLPLSGDRSWTIEQFKQIAEKFPFERDGKKIYATQIKNTDGGFEKLQFLWNFGATLYNEDNTKFILNSAEGIAGAEFLTEMIKGGKFRLLTGGGQSSEFWEGDTAFGMDGAFTEEKMMKVIADKSPDSRKSNPDEIVAMQFPRGPGVENARTYAGFGGLPIFKVASKNENHTKTVTEFASFVTGTDNQFNVKNSGCFPVRRSAGDIYGDDKNAAIATSMLDYGEDLGRGDSANKIYDIYINPAFDEMFIGDKTPKEALDALADKANEILNEK